LHALRRLRPALERSGAGGRQCLLTASCGSGRMSVQREAAIATALWDTAHTLHGDVKASNTCVPPMPAAS
jgi:hypothetical protein